MRLPPNMLHNFPVDTLAVDLCFAFFVTHYFVRGKSVYCRHEVKEEYTIFMRKVNPAEHFGHLFLTLPLKGTDDPL